MKEGENNGSNGNYSGNEYPFRDHRVLLLVIGAKDNEKGKRAGRKKEAVREKQELLIVKSIGAAISLGEATAEAVARIPDAHCNGDMHAALEYARKIKHEQKDFLTQQGIEAIY